MKQTTWKLIKNAWKLRWGNFLKAWGSAWDSSKDTIINFVQSIFGYIWVIIKLLQEFVIGGLYDTGKIILQWLIGKIRRI